MSRGDGGYRRFRAAMLDGRISPGQIVTQSELCTLLETSLSPLRDTLTLLEADGLITVRKRAGIRVFDPDIEFIRHNFQFRTLIEREALPAFVDTVADDWIADMHERHAALRQTIDARRPVRETERAMRDLDKAFHGAIVAALRNPMISDVHQISMENIKLARIFNHEMMSPMRLRDTLGEHRVMLAAFGERDQDAAAAALDAHFSQSIHRVFR